MPARVLVRALIASILGFVIASVVYAADNEPAGLPETRSMRIELQDGSSLVGMLSQNIRLTTDYGFEEIDAKHVRRITFRPPEDDKASDIVELNDRSQHRGRIQGPFLELLIDHQFRRTPIRDLRELKAIRKGSSGLFAILFGLLTLTAMEIVLGIDNVIFLAIIAGKLPPQQQPRARKLGLTAALGTRILLLATLSFLLGLTKPLFTLPDLPLLHDLEAREVSLRDLILLVGGLFLIGKSVLEVHEKFEAGAAGAVGELGEAGERKNDPKPVSGARFAKVLVQIAIIDIVFSLDSVITAVGMVEELWVMMVAVVLAMLVMLVFSGYISDFVGRHPTLKVLALSFLILIGVMLTAEGLGQHMNKGYIYFAMAFAVAVEMVNLKLGKKPAGVHSRQPV